MHVLISRKNEEDPIKNETCKSMGIFFPNTQGQLTLQSMFGYDGNSNTSETSWFSL